MRSILTLIALSTLLMFSVDSYAWVNSISKSNNSPNVCSTFTITVNGDMPSSTYGVSNVTKSVSGSTITINVYLVDGGGIGIPVITPYSTSKSFTDLDAKAYSIVVKDYFNGSFSSQKTSNITVSGFNNVTTNNIKDKSATMNWSKIGCSCNYRLQGRLAGTTTWTDITIAGSNNNFYNASGLAPGTTYEWRVKTDCPTAGAATSSIKTFTTTNCRKPNPISTQNVTANSADLTWTAVGSGVGFEIWGREVGQTAKVKLVINSFGTTSYNAVNLPSNTAFEWVVRTKCTSNPDRYSGFSSVSNFTTLGPASKLAIATEELKIYPNPFSQKATLVLPDDGEDYTLIISDITGKEVELESQLNGNTMIIDRGDLPSGIYFYRVFNDDKSHSGRFAIQ